jgi:hypothetical protein
MVDEPHVSRNMGFCLSGGRPNWPKKKSPDESGLFLGYYSFKAQTEINSACTALQALRCLYINVIYSPACKNLFSQGDSLKSQLA